MKPGGCAVRHKGPHHAATLPRGALPDDHHTVGPFSSPLLQKGHHVCRSHGAILAVAVQLAFRREGTKGRAMIPRPPLPAPGWVPYRGIGVDPTGHGREPGLRDHAERLPSGLCPRLRAGQVSSRQRVRAASSRWRARRAGFWGRQRMAGRKRPTWPAWEEMPKARWITAAIRPQVQTCPRQPSASAPRGQRAGPRHPWADSPVADAEGGGDLPLGPALLEMVPGLNSSALLPSFGYGVHPEEWSTGPSEL
jgi:hypothetical protein